MRLFLQSAQFCQRGLVTGRFSLLGGNFLLFGGVGFLVFFGYVVVEEFFVSIRFEFVDVCSFVCWD